MKTAVKGGWPMGRATSAVTSDVDDTPPTPRHHLPLKTIEDVRCELASLYREARDNSRNVSDASKLANMLYILGRMIESSDLERRITDLEAADARGKGAA